jgi:uncharacterized protein (TIGR03435 family)
MRSAKFRSDRGSVTNDPQVPILSRDHRERFNVARSALLCAFFCLTAAAQTPNPMLQFDVATIKASAPLNRNNRNGSALAAGVHGGPGSDQPELLTIGRMTIRGLLLRAFGIKGLQLSGPAWMAEGGSGLFDITAKVAAGATTEQANVMLQNLLVERFGLVFHRETTDVPGYELVVAKGGPKLTESTEVPPPPAPAVSADGAPRAPVGKIENDRNGVPQLPAGRPGILTSMSAGNKMFLSGRVQSMTQLATAIEAVLAKPVADRTGLSAKYDFGFGFDANDSPEGRRQIAAMIAQRAKSQAPAPAAELAPSIFTAIQQDLGLRLDQKKISTVIIVVDEVEKAPTGN